MRTALAFLAGASLPALLLGWCILGLCLRRFGRLYVTIRVADTPPPRRLAVILFCLLHAISECGRRLATWGDRHAGRHRISWTCGLVIWRHVPGLSEPRSPAEAAEDLITTTRRATPE